MYYKEKITLFLPIAFFLLFFNPGHSVYCLDFSFGFRAGMNMSLCYGKEYGNQLDASGDKRSILPGFEGGAFLSIGVIKFLALQPEVYFAHLGYKIKSGSTKIKLRYSTVMIPLLVKFRLMFSSWTLNFFTGPNLIIKTAGDEKLRQNDSYSTVSYEDFNPFTFGLVFGMSCDINIGGYTFINIDARYMLGLVNIFNKNRVSSSENMKPMSFSLSLGFGLKNWKKEKEEIIEEEEIEEEKKDRKERREERKEEKRLKKEEKDKGEEETVQLEIEGEEEEVDKKTERKNKREEKKEERRIKKEEKKKEKEERKKEKESE